MSSGGEAEAGMRVQYVNNVMRKVVAGSNFRVIGLFVVLRREECLEFFIGDIDIGILLEYGSDLFRLRIYQYRFQPVAAKLVF